MAGFIRFCTTLFLRLRRTGATLRCSVCGRVVSRNAPGASWSLLGCVAMAICILVYSNHGAINMVCGWSVSLVLDYHRHYLSNYVAQMLVPISKAKFTAKELGMRARLT